VAQGTLSTLSHELHHVVLGPSSADHHGWCPFFAWEWGAGLARVLRMRSVMKPRLYPA
jgi:hypothetical protein